MASIVSTIESWPYGVLLNHGVYLPAGFLTVIALSLFFFSTRTKPPINSKLPKEKKNLSDLQSVSIAFYKTE